MYIKLKKLREDKGITQDEMAEYLDIDIRVVILS